MSNIEIIKKKLKDLKDILNQEYGISEIGIFGSYVRGEERESSDLDILVQTNKRMGLLKFIGIENYLTDVLNVKVDLVMKDVLKPTIGKQILKEVNYI